MELPLQLLESLKQVRGFNPDAFLQSHSAAPPVSIRFNPSKPYLVSGLELAARVPWSTQGHYLKERPVFTLDPAIHAGAYYVQEASSMFVEYALSKVLGDVRGLTALDLCAAPGGKTTLLASMPHFDMVLANEIIRTRVNILYENTVKWGAPKIIVSNNDPSSFSKLNAWFDVMVVDAPCSGSGLFRKDPDALKEWSGNNVQLCSERQKRILADALPALREGGILVYSTCSYSPEEDEEIMDWIMTHGELYPITLDPHPDWGIVEVQGEKGGAGYRFFPDRVKGEGFFLACFRKGEGLLGGERSYGKKTVLASFEKAMKGWVDVSKEMAVREKGQELFLLPAGIEPRVRELEQVLSLRKNGVRAGTMIRDSFIPDHELVLSEYLSHEAPFLDLDRTDALKFLRKQDILPDVKQKGWHVIRYEGLALGLIKHLGNRVNNYYPASWRILMS